MLWIKIDFSITFTTRYQYDWSLKPYAKISTINPKSLSIAKTLISIDHLSLIMTLICIRPLISTRSICGLISASFSTPQLFQIVRSACSSPWSNCSRSTSSLTASTSSHTINPDQLNLSSRTARKQFGPVRVRFQFVPVHVSSFSWWSIQPIKGLRYT